MKTELKITVLFILFFVAFYGYNSVISKGYSASRVNIECQTENDSSTDTNFSGQDFSDDESFCFSKSFFPKSDYTVFLPFKKAVFLLPEYTVSIWQPPKAL